ncbi:MAG: MBL fold metallo-hydrolase [Brevinema sp.]
MINFIDILNTGFGVSIVFSLRNQDQDYIVLLDSGDNNPEIYKDSRRIKITEYLKRKNIKEIDMAILSHIHRDHIAGYNEILDQGYRIRTFLSNFPSVPNLLDMNAIVQKYQDLPTQYIVFSLYEYQKLLNRMKYDTVIHYVDTPMKFAIGNYELKVVPTTSKIIQESLEYLAQSNNSLLDLEDRYHSLRIFDSQLNQTTLSLLLSTKTKYLFYSAGERDLSKNKNCILQDFVDILHCPHHGDSKYLGESLKTLSPKWIVVCSDSQRSYGLPSIDLEETVQRYCSSNLIYTETKNSTYQWITFLLDSENMMPIYITKNNIP